MTYYDEIYDYAIDNHFLVTTDDARELGIPPVELAKLANRGKLENISRGLYRIAKYVPGDNDSFAISVARGGQGAYLYGESVLAMLDLTPTNLSRTFIATPKRVRSKTAPGTLRFIPAKNSETPTVYDGVASQSVFNAIKSCAGQMMPERLMQAAQNAKTQGYITQKEYNQLLHDGIIE